MVKLSNLETPLKNFEGEELKADKGSLTLKKVLLTHLGAFAPEKPAQGEEMIKAYNLGALISKETEEVDVSPDHLKFLQGILNKKPVFTTLVMGQVLQTIQEAIDSDKIPAESTTPAAGK